jgi:POT family proton-dependent oligopeptide transporter
VSATFLGHPRGLATLFFTEMWERFTYYGMRAVLVLFLVGAVSSGGFGIDDKTAAAIYGLYTAGVYLAALPGGWIADRLIGARRAVFIGGALITLGNAMLAASTTPRGFYLGLLVIVLGVGLLKPNVSAMVAELYPEGGARLDAGFTVFYMGINLGGGATARRPWRRLWIALAAAALAVAALSFGWLPVNPVGLAHASTLVIAATAVLYFAYLFLAGNLSALEKRRVLVIVVLFLGSVLFWSGYEQAGSSLNLFAERYTDRALGSFVIPASWFQSLNPAFVIAFAPLVAWVWIALARRRLKPSAPASFAIGVILMGSGFVVMAVAASIVAHGSKVLPYWLIATYLLHTLGELCLSPVGLSYTTKLSPKRLVGQMMGMWFLSLSLGNLAAGLIAGEFDANNVAAMPGQYRHIVYFAVGLGAVLLALSRPVKRLMGDLQ